MIELDAAQIAEIVGGELHAESAVLVTAAPVIDSREATPG